MINLNTSTATSGNGIDVAAVVDQILYAERAPERLWQSQQSALKAEATALQALQTSTSKLSDAVNNLKDIFGALARKLVTTSDSSVLTGSAQSAAGTGTHIIKVANLAVTSSYYTDALPTGTALGAGAFSIKVGTAAATLITLDSSAQTVSALATAINKKDAGVTATVIRDATGERLALVSKTSGAPGDIVVSDNTTSMVFHKAVSGTNASLTLDGVPINSSTNTVTGVVDGLTLNLMSAVPDKEVTLTIGSDNEGSKQAVQDFVSSYNAVIQSITSQFASGSPSTAGPLASNGSLRTMEMDLLSAAAFSISGNNGFVNLASFGVEMANDGSLSVNDTKLSDAITNHLPEFQNFFQSLTGFGVNFSKNLHSLTESTTGLLSLNLTENTNKQSFLTQQISDFEDRLVYRQKALLEEYSRIDTQLRQLPLLQSQISSQLNALSKN